MDHLAAASRPARARGRPCCGRFDLQVRVSRLIGMYYFADEPWLAFAFRCEIEQGEPALPDTGEIAEIGWFDPHDLPTPLTNLAPRAIPDAVCGEYGIVRDFAAR